ncbi:MAG: DNA polymerase III subunit beta [bacterium]
MEGKFVVEQKELLALLASMQPICNKRTSLDITESIMFEVAPRELTLKATDLEISLQAHMAIESNFEENKNFLISGKRIFELVKEMDGQIEFDIHENQLHLKADGIDLALNIKDPEEFPPFPEKIENLMNFDSAFLLGALNKIAFLIPQNNANSALNGMLIEFDSTRMSFVTTDGHCLARLTSTKYTLEEEKKWLLPKRAALELKKLLESNTDDKVFLGTCGNQLVFSGKNFNLFTRLVSDPFPQYQPVLNKDGFFPAQLAKDQLVRTLKRTGCLLAGQFVATNFTFAPKSVTVKLQNKEVGKLEESINMQGYEGDKVESRFYSPYLLNGLQVFPKADISFFVKDSTRPIIFEAQEEEYHLTYLVMPVSMVQN